MTPAPAVSRRIVLVGGGHTHVEVLRSFGMRPQPGVRLTVIAKEIEAPYSGMLPGFIAGHYSHDECHIDVVRLAQFAGARVIRGEACGIDRINKRVLIGGRAPVGYDLLSINTGITPLLDGIAGADQHALAVKPVSTFAPRWQALEEAALAPGGPRRFAIIGTGAAGFELILAIRYRLRERAPQHRINPDDFSFTLIGSSDLLPSHNARARRLAREALVAANVGLVIDDAATAVSAMHVSLASGKQVQADAVLITTKAAAPAWFATTDLPRDGGGFLAVRPTLQVLDDDDVFAVGDCATVLDHKREKSGVFAVRQGPPLTDNLRRRAQGEAAVPFTPQRYFLSLLSTGERSAIASRGPFAASGRWAWSWKDRIDRRFMAMYAAAGSQSMPANADAMTAEDMRCRGCAAKVGPRALAEALARLAPKDVVSGGALIRDLSPGDDAAVLDLGGPDLRIETVDHFPAFWPEPYLFGEVTAAHAVSDIFAMGGRPDHALALVTLPYATDNVAADDLYQLMAGARSVLARDGVSIVGGHSSEGPELAAGLFVSGTVGRESVLTKSRLQPGDCLILTRPIGTGVLFAAWMRGKARGIHIMAALDAMRETNAIAASVLTAHGATACTDVTGFGLAGHLLNLLEASAVSAEIRLGAVPLYAGAMERARAGITSSLLPENLALATSLVGAPPIDDTTLAILFDPQTSGGLLCGVPHERAQQAIAALHEAGIAVARIIGTVRSPSADRDQVLRVLP